jgi:hypothetical protein
MPALKRFKEKGNDMTSDFYERDTSVDVDSVVGKGGGLSDAGISAMQGPTDNQPETLSDTPDTKTIGDPVSDAQHWHKQQHSDTCAVVAQEGIIEKHTNEDPSENALRQEAIEKGWFNGGTPPADVGKLLESHDVPVGFQGRGNMEQLQNELEQGRDVIALVDAGHLWQDPDYLGDGHAVWVTGLETDNNDEVTHVFLNDSGNSDIGAGGRVPVGVFEKAWQEWDSNMIVTKDPAPTDTKGVK